MTKEFFIPEPRYVVDKTGKKVEVLLDAKVYEQLVAAVEDFCLGKMAQEVMETESKEEYLDFDEIREDLLKDDDE